MVIRTWNGPSKSETYLQNKDQTPVATVAMAKSVSAFRREGISAEIEQGLFKDGMSNVRVNNSTTALGNVIGSGSGLNKFAQVSSTSNFRGPGGTVQQNPEVYSPLWLDSNLSLPRDRATINAWLRAFYALNPFVHNAINLHSTFPISKLNIKCSNKEVEKFFNEMSEEIDLINVCVQIAQQFWLLGESFPYAEMDDSKGKWSRIHIQNPDFIVVNRTIAADQPLIQLRPDENLKKIVMSNKPSDIEQKRQLNQYIIDTVKRNQNITLNNLEISHLARKIDPCEVRGTGLPVCIFRQLMLFDRLRESKFAQASGMINPLTLVKIGNENYKPTFADLEAYKNVFEGIQFNKDAKIFTHEGVVVEKIIGTPYDISGDVTQLIKEIYIGLQVPSVLMDGGADTTYANGGVALDVLRNRYMQFRNILSSWLKRKIFAPVSKIQGFYENNNGKKELIIPDIEWNHMSLFDAGDYINNLVQLTQGEGPAKRASLHSLYRSLGLEFEDETRKMRKEAIQEIILKKEKAAMETMDLNSLRALDDDDEIPEPKAGENGAPPGGLPGEAPPGGLPGMDMSMPPPPGVGTPPIPPPA